MLTPGQMLPMLIKVPWFCFVLIYCDNHPPESSLYVRIVLIFYDIAL